MGVFLLPIGAPPSPPGSHWRVRPDPASGPHLLPGLLPLPAQSGYEAAGGTGQVRGFSDFSERHYREDAMLLQRGPVSRTPI